MSIVILHRVLAQPDPLFPEEPDAGFFTRLCGWLREGFEVLPLPLAVERLKSRSLPARALSITFDDGYADNHDVALPILRAAGLTATFFVSTGFLDGGRMWNDTVIEAIRRCPREQLDLSASGAAPLGTFTLADAQARRRAIDDIIAGIKHLEPHIRQAQADEVARRSGAMLPDDLMMRSAQVVALHRAGMDIGGHTVTHPILTTLAPDAVRREIGDGKRALETLIGEPVRVFAYPNGKPGRDYHADAVAAVREAGFDAAVTTAWGAADGESDPLQLPRFMPWDRSAWRFRARMVQNLRRSRGGRFETVARSTP